MPAFPLLALCAVLVVSGCASRGPSTSAAPVVAPPKQTATSPARGNRFEMVQGGRRMSADDFDRWMKARGIRIARGPAPAARKPKPKTPAPRR